MQEIDQVMHAAFSANKPCVLAIVVNTMGSTYRRAGAAMLVRDDGSIVGAVSGGCIEKEIVRRAQSVFASSQPQLMAYDGRYTLGCNGTLIILLELFDPPEYQALFQQYHLAFRSRREWSVIANLQGESIGAAMVFANDTVFLASSAGNPASRFANLKSRLQTSDGFNSPSDGWFGLAIRPCRQLCIIGSEMDAVKLATLATELGFICQLVTHPRNPHGDQQYAAFKTCVVAPESIRQQVPIDERTAVVLMTHSYSRDLAYLKALLDGTRISYLGMVGPKQRSDELISDLFDMSGTLPDWLEGSLRAPAGLDLGGEIPAEVALAILAEIQMVFAGHAGGELSKKTTGIHSPREIASDGSGADKPVLTFSE